MKITVTEFKENFDKYLDLLESETVYITQDGVVIAKLSNPREDKIYLLNQLAGVASGSDADRDNIRDERLSTK